MTPAPALHAGLDFGAEQITVRLAGEIDVFTAPDLAAVFDAAGSRDRSRVIVDLADVEFMGVAGLNLIAGLAVQLRASGGQLLVRSASTLTRRLLNLTGLGDLVDFEPPHAATSDAPSTSEHAVVRSLDEMRVATRSRERIIDAAFGVVVAWAAATIDSAGASVTLRRRGRLITVASSDDTSSRLDASQYATEQGPCVHAATTGRTAHVAATVDDPRWPDFLPRALDAGIAAILSTPLAVPAGPVGALNLYTPSHEGFTAEQREIAELIAGQAARILAGDKEDLTTPGDVRRLQDALRSRDVFNQAQGVLMQRHNITAAIAAAYLRRASRQADIPMRELAADLIAPTGEPTDPRVGG